MGSTNSDVFSAIADSTRRDLLLRLADGEERSVTTLLAPYAVSQPAISKHLRVLREAGLVRSRKAGRLMMYRIEASRLQQVHNWITHFERYWDQKLDALGDYLDQKQRRSKTPNSSTRQ